MNFEGYKHSFCAFCGVTNFTEQFMFCSKCRVVVYCSKEHQVMHWKKHKKFCKMNIWKSNNPYGVAASENCEVTSCACKKWYVETSSNWNGLDNTNGASFRTSSVSQSSSTNPNVVDNENDYVGLVGNGTSSTEESVIAQSSKKVNVNGASSNNPMMTRGTNSAGPVNNVASSSSTSIGPVISYDNSEVEISLDDGSRLFESIMKQSSLPLNSQNFPVEDLENTAPAASSPSPNSLDLQVLRAPVCGQLYSGFSGTASVCNITERTLHLRSNSLPYSSSPSSSDSATSSSKAKEDDLMISRNDNIQREDNMSMIHSSSSIPFQHRNNMQYICGQSAQQMKHWINQVWQQVIDDMNRYGVCVVDNLLGEVRGAAVFREVQAMYSKGAFQDGQLVKSKDVQSKSIRGDKITWVDGREPYCRNISVLIKLLDNIVMGANNRRNNGKLGTYRINERSKAMVACYPGSGTHYVKHVDNPNDDGRCVTAIYYLNKEWNTQENGGLLRIFPEGWSHQVADIEPLFDRVIFFWSDRRNPHEVQPAYKTRYAITLWYFDSNAKARAKVSAAETKSKSGTLAAIS